MKILHMKILHMKILHMKIFHTKILHMKTYVHLWQYVAEFFLEYETFQKSNKGKTHVIFSNYFLKIVIFMR
jgi:hypothetical protein